MTEIPAWVPIASPWVVAAIGALALLLVRKLRGPVTIQDLWAENRSLRADLTTVQDQVNALITASNTQLAVNRTLGDGFDAMTAAVERSEVDIHFTRAEQEAIDRARALRGDERRWDTLQRAGLPEMPEPGEEQP